MKKRKEKSEEKGKTEKDEGKEEKRKGKSPWVAAVLNLIVPGIGYIYAGKKRTVFSVFLALAFALITIANFMGGASVKFESALTKIMYNAVSISYLLLLIVFAWDAYKDVEEE